MEAKVHSTEIYPFPLLSSLRNLYKEQLVLLNSHRTKTLSFTLPIVTVWKQLMSPKVLQTTAISFSTASTVLQTKDSLSNSRETNTVLNRSQTENTLKSQTMIKTTECGLRLTIKDQRASYGPLRRRQILNMQAKGHIILDLCSARLWRCREVS